MQMRRAAERDGGHKDCAEAVLFKTPMAGRASADKSRVLKVLFMPSLLHGACRTKAPSEA